MQRASMYVQVPRCGIIPQWKHLSQMPKPLQYAVVVMQGAWGFCKGPFCEHEPMLRFLSIREPTEASEYRVYEV